MPGFDKSQIGIVADLQTGLGTDIIPGKYCVHLPAHRIQHPPNHLEGNFQDRITDGIQYLCFQCNVAVPVFKPSDVLTDMNKRRGKR